MQIIGHRIRYSGIAFLFICYNSDISKINWMIVITVNYLFEQNFDICIIERRAIILCILLKCMLYCFISTPVSTLLSFIIILHSYDLGTCSLQHIINL